MITLLVTVVLSLAAWWVKRKRISYRVHLDTPIGIAPARGSNLIDVELKNRGKAVDKPSFALVRIMNTGSAAIRPGDFAAPLRLDFAGRRVVDVEVVEADRAVLRMFDEDASWPPVGKNALVLPKVPLNRKHRIKLLVLLSGEPDPKVKPAVACEAFLVGGRVVHDTTTGDGPSRRSMWLAAVAMVLVSASVALVVSGVVAPRSSDCAAGRLVVEGSSAFAPVAEKVAASYMDKCGDAEVTVAGVSTYTGLDRLVDSAGSGVSRIAMTDGPADGPKYNRLVPHPVGTATFALVAHKSAGVTGLTTEELKAIYTGARRSWREDGSLPITIVSRNFQSGTRAAFEGSVLGEREPKATASRDCTPPVQEVPPPVLRCEKTEGADVLSTVAQIPGAIGYVELAAAQKAHDANPDVVVLSLDGVDPAAVATRRDYRFRAPEFFYTVDKPAKGSLIDSFIDYMDGDAAKQIIADAGFGQ
ncbi:MULTISPECIES: substrate-binding domain-containing protein [unclassified Saccharothrix]|uniref:substrate-binding domain-containing protein n=1 Tax=unclassified Saccharothrix TaxID=2593673 RepID=UPI00307E425B